MTRLTNIEKRPLMGVYLSMIDLRKTKNVGAIALADMFIDAYNSKYGEPSATTDVKGSPRETFVLKVLESNREHIKDQELLDIADQLIKVLEKSIKAKV